MNDRRAFLGMAGAASIAALALGRSAEAPARGHFPINRTPADWRSKMGAQRFAVLRQAATEPPYTSPLLKEHRKGAFLCAGCAQPLFASATKFESGTGWPSFWRPLPKAVVTRSDREMMVERTEVL